jgi:predicted RNase H-like HicB family nuclease
MIANDEIATDAVAVSSPSREVRHCERCGEPLITVPSLRCEECGAVRRLRCFVRRASDVYIAECIDLDICAEGDTLESAIKGLQDAIDMYLADAAEIGDLVLRPAPLLHRVRYRLECAKDALTAFLSRSSHGSTESMEKFFSVSVKSCHI